MRQFFSESYSKICVDAPREQIESRWTGIETYCGKKEYDVYQLVKMYYMLKVSDAFSQEFVSNFHDIDITFDKNNKRELSVLAGNILYNLMKNEDYNLSVIFSLICLSKYEIDVALPDIIEKAYKTFGERSAAVREREITYKNVALKPSKDFATSLKDLTALEEGNITGLMAAMNSINSNIAILMQNQAQMKKAIEIYQEDSNILAWLFGSWSNDLQTALTKKIEQKSASLVLAKELADLVGVAPGPYPVESFLSKMLGLCKTDKNKYSLVAMVDFIERKSKENILGQYNCIDSTPENTPILFSIKSALATDKPEVWQYTVSNAIGFDISTIENTVLEWALLMYFECMLIKGHECE